MYLKKNLIPKLFYYKIKKIFKYYEQTVYYTHSMRSVFFFILF